MTSFPTIATSKQRQIAKAVEGALSRMKKADNGNSVQFTPRDRRALVKAHKQGEKVLNEAYNIITGIRGYQRMYCGTPTPGTEPLTRTDHIPTRRMIRDAARRAEAEGPGEPSSTSFMPPIWWPDVDVRSEEHDNSSRDLYITPLGTGQNLSAAGWKNDPAFQKMLEKLGQWISEIGSTGKMPRIDMERLQQRLRVFESAFAALEALAGSYPKVKAAEIRQRDATDKLQSSVEAGLQKIRQPRRVRPPYPFPMPRPYDG